MKPYDLYSEKSLKLLPLLDVSKFDLSFVGDSLLICIPGILNGVDLNIGEALANLSSIYNKKIKLVINTWDVVECTDTLKTLDKELKKYEDLDIYVSTVSYDSPEFKRFFRIFLEEFNVNADTLNVTHVLFRRLVAFYAYHKAFSTIDSIVENNTLVFKTRAPFKFNSHNKLTWFHRLVNEAVENRGLFVGMPPRDILKTDGGKRWLLSSATAFGYVDDSQFLIPSKYGKEVFYESSEQLARTLATIVKDHLTDFIPEKELLGDMPKLESFLCSSNLFLSYQGGFLINDLVARNKGVTISDYNSKILLLGSTSTKLPHKLYAFKNDKTVVHR